MYSFKFQGIHEHMKLSLHLSFITMLHIKDHHLWSGCSHQHCFFVWTPSRHRGDTWLITTVSCVQSPSPGRRTWSATWNDTSTKERPRPVTLGTLTYRLRSRVMNTHTVSAHGSLSLPVLTSVSSDPTSQQSTLTNHLILRVVSWGQT